MWEDDRFLAFLDIHPISTGHTLVIPKVEVDYLFNLDDKTYSDLMLVCKKIVPAIQSVVPCIRVGAMVAGLAVPHAHIHLVPMQGEGDLNFANAKDADMKELATLALKIKAHIV